MSTEIDATHPLRSITIADYAREENAKRNAQAKAEGWSGWGLIPEDTAFVAEYPTAYDYVRSCAISDLSDTYKEIKGFRPRGIYPIEEMTLADLESALQNLFDKGV